MAKEDSKMTTAKEYNDYEPDVILIDSNTAQLRVMLMAIVYKDGKIVTSEFNYLESCDEGSWL